MAIYRNKVSEIKETVTSSFYEDVVEGLSSSPKYLQSKYFYDEQGDKLFQQIMNSPEYYLTNCEMEVFVSKSEAIANFCLKRLSAFDVLELGAGDAIKSTHLLQQLAKSGNDFTYYPVDISQNVIDLLHEEMPGRVPGIRIQGLTGEYFEMIEKAYEISGRRKVVLFLGSNIGNFNEDKAREFLLSLQQHLLPGDIVVIGFDLKKNPKQILAAYNDAAGITKEFNLNLLKRINRDLDADFIIDQFDHYASYDPISGDCRSFLISLQDQEVHLNHSYKISFSGNEPIYMELSKKYAPAEIHALAEETGFTPVAHFYDNNKWFVDIVLEHK